MRGWPGVGVVAVVLAASFAGGGGMAQGQTPAPPRPPAAARRPVVTELAVEKYVLANGLEVILHVDRRTPQVAVNVTYGVGSKDEPPGRLEYAHLFEHLAFEGSAHVPTGQHFELLGRAGATDVNATTYEDRTAYYETVPRHQLPLALWLESDRMGFLTSAMEAGPLGKQRGVVRAERRLKNETRPYGFVRDLLKGALFPAGHPYHVASPEQRFVDLMRATPRDAVDFHQRFYGPNNATLAIVGDLDVARTKELIAKYFATLPRRPSTRTPRTPVPTTLTSEKQIVIEADVPAAAIHVWWPTPPHFAPGDAELDVIARVLGGDGAGRLNQRLAAAGIASFVNVRQVSRLLASTFEIEISLRPGATVAAARAILDEELEALRATPLREDELARARAHTAVAALSDVESLKQRARRLQLYNHVTGDPRRLARDVERYGSVTTADIARAATAHLPADRRVFAVVEPTRGAPIAGRLAARRSP